MLKIFILNILLCSLFLNVWFFLNKFQNKIQFFRTVIKLKKILLVNIYVMRLLAVILYTYHSLNSIFFCMVVLILLFCLNLTLVYLIKWNPQISFTDQLYYFIILYLVGVYLKCLKIIILFVIIFQFLKYSSKTKEDLSIIIAKNRMIFNPNKLNKRILESIFQSNEMFTQRNSNKLYFACIFCLCLLGFPLYIS